MMPIGTILRYKDRDTYDKLIQLHRVKEDKPKKKIALGDDIESLMGHRSYKKVSGRVRQR